MEPQAHLFEGDASEIMDAIILTGKVTCKKSELGYFPTPKNIVRRLIELADVMPHMSILEPSAGQGAIAQELAKIAADVCCYEIDGGNVVVLLKKEITSATRDFLSVEPSPTFDRVVMNPPFTKQMDILHVLHAYKFLKPGGRLVSVMASGVEFRSNKLTTDFRQFIISHNGGIEALPEGSFLESGTGVNTVIVTIAS